MKKLGVKIVGLLLLAFPMFSQTKAISYQAVIMDPNQIEIPGQNIVGQPLSNGSVCIKFTIINSDKSIDYEEVQSAQTDEFGLVNLTIGASTATSSNSKITLLGTGTYKDFNTIKWDKNRKSLKVSVSFDNCTSFKVTSVELLNFTPYAIYASAVDYENVNGAPTNLSQFNNDSGFLNQTALDPLKKDISQTQNNLTDLTNKSNNRFSIVDSTLSTFDNRINSNSKSIAQTNTVLNQQVGGLQQQITTTNTTINQLGGTYEVVSNKSNASDLGAGTPSSEYYPTQLAVKTYVDQSIQNSVASGAPDATTLAKGKLKLAGDLAGTADAPTVPGLSNKENTSNKSTSISTDGSSDTKYPSAKAVKDYVDASVSGVAFQTNLDAKADKNSPTFTGTPSMPTGTTGVTQSNTDNSTKLATTAFVQNAISAGVIDATTSDKGKLKLAGDLGGTADLPTVPGLAIKAPLASPALTGTPTAPTATAGTNTTQIATTAFVAAAMTNASVADATTTDKGKIQLAGDLGGTAALPTVPGLANKENTIAAGTTSQYFRGDKSWQTLDKTAVGLGNVDNTSDASKPVSTATQTALDLKLAKSDTTSLSNRIDLKENAANKSDNTSLGTSSSLFPTQNAVKTYVDNQVSNATISDATTSAKGKIQLAGDLGGTGTTAAAPVISDNAIIASKIASSAITNAKIADGSVTTTKIADSNVTTAKLADGSITTAKIDAASITNAKIGETISIANGGTGASTQAGAFDALSPMTTSGDIIYGGTSGTGTRLGKGTDGQVLTLASGVPSWSTPAATGLTSLNGLSGGTQTFATGTSGTDFNISSSSSTHTFNIPDASATARGLVTTGTQTIAGAKTFSSDIILRTMTLGSASGGVQNTVFGRSALAANTSGSYNVVIGSDAGASNTTGTYNVFMGRIAGNLNTTGGGNVTIGYRSGTSNTTGSNNSFYGMGSGSDNTTGAQNTFIGFNTGQGVSTGNYNTVIGSQVKNFGDVSNNVIIGDGQGNIRAQHNGTSWTLGTISSGTWNGTTIGIAYGGTGATTKAGAFDALSPMTSAGDIIYGGTSGTGTSLGIGSTGQVLTVSAGGAPTWSTPSSGGVTTIGSVSGSSTANGASISSTTLSLAPADGTNPGIVTTGAQTFAGVKTFSSTITGDISGNAGSVTNGVYTTNKLSALSSTTSSELAGVISNETGSGALVFATSPTLVTPTLGVASATSINGLTPTAQTTGFTIAGGTTSKTLTVSGDATVSGMNTGDQTITLTGDVTGSGTGSFATTIGAGKVTSSMLANNAITEVSDEITATAGQTSFTLTHAKGTNRTLKMYINGIRISNTAYSDSGTTLTYTSSGNGSYTIAAGDRVQFDYSY